MTFVLRQRLSNLLIDTKMKNRLIIEWWGGGRERERERERKRE